MGGEIEAGKVHCSMFKMSEGNTKYTKETVLFDKDQREWEKEVCLRVLESRLPLPALVISGRPGVCVCVCVCPEGCIKLK